MQTHSQKSLVLLAIIVIGVVTAKGQAVTNSPAKPKWVSDVSAGLTLTRGNSDTTLASLTAATDRKTDMDEWSLGANATYGKARVTVNGVNESSTTAQQADAFLQYNYLFTARFYGYARVEGLHDDVADVHYRLTVGPGLGYYLVKNKRMDFSLELGPGFISQELGSVRQNYAILRGAEKFHLQLSDRARVWESAEIDPDVENWGNYIITAEIGVEADLMANKSLSLQCYVDDTYDSKPAVGRLKNDAKTVVAIDYKF
jgi:putative salt-induced outer membrane protein YdiY